MKRTKQSQKRTKFLLLLLVLTAILSITATYAWFSTQRDVEITGMRLNVEVAESMQISLNGETWVQSISITDMKQFYGTASSGHQAIGIGTTSTNQNYVPRELLPISSAGELGTGDSAGQLQFVKGEISGTTLKSVTKCSEADFTIGTTTNYSSATIETRETGNAQHPYLVFDMYLRNVSAGTSNDTLRLNTGSMVFVDTLASSQTEGSGKTGTGLEYSARVGLVRYGETLSINATGDNLGESIRTLKPVSGTNNPQVAVWEPNHLHHTDYVVKNNDRVTGLSDNDVTTYPLRASKLVETGSAYEDIANTGTTGASSALISTLTTFKPAYTLPSIDLGDTSVTTDDKWVGGVTAESGHAEGSGPKITDIAGSEFGIAPNAISKVRVYVWLEGQDPDCVDLASTGDKLNITLKLVKDKNSAVTPPSYK